MLSSHSQHKASACMARPKRQATFKSSPHLPVQNAAPDRRFPTSTSSVSLAFPQSASMHSLLAQTSQLRSSGTWTTSSGELGLLGDTDEVEDRSVFVHEYNRLAKKVQALDAQASRCPLQRPGG
ncbi:hypothetical protein CDD83_5912 [Cordyceps sp. RAO-2017]|nr:hypothetical protein CDD83_5912 [Cordyceps sp. RAO-2017]